ncbi:hypothetical protein VNI00_001378 [Paramarasmius palmivorus]|uniref:Uncharacterized protein n=1 Tax=Paramarasmius palmivorus TaxID=297713 RepID=A0AAW0E6X5_9AGAR
MLGPLAILAAIMQLVPISSSAQVNDVASAIRNVCNATLSLLFTAALFIWGLLVNRKQAWRTDGGTAVFGAAALALAVASTALSFLDIPREEEVFWGGGGGLVARRVVPGLQGTNQQEKTPPRRLSEEAKKSQGEGKRGERKDDGNRVKAVAPENLFPVDGGVCFSSRGGDGDEIEEVPRARTRRRRRETSSPTARRSRSPHTEVSSPSNATSTTDTTSSFLPSVIYHWFANLRQAHLTAARIQAAERRERILELERAERERVRAEVESRRRGNETNNTSPWFRVGVPGTGWGLGSSGWRMENGGVEQVEMQTYPRKSEDEGSTSPRHRGSLRRTDTNADIEIHSPSEAAAASPPEVPIQNTHDPPAPETPQRRSSVFWWGPFRRWRLQDSTIY